MFREKDNLEPTLESGRSTLTNSPRPSLPGMLFRVLVIDDSLTVVRAVVRAFAQTSCEVETVEHYLDIPRYLRQTPPDLVILDLNMPGLSGERISDFIRRDQQRDTPIVIYSSLPEEKLRAAASRTGAAGWISKQASLGELVAFVEATLSQQKRHGHR